MTKTKKAIKPRFKKTESLVEMQAKDAALKAVNKGKGISKTATLIKAGVAEGESAGAFSRPDESQLEKINQFTRTPKTADELYVFDTLSMNDLADRDDDVFVTDTVKEFAALPQPFSPIGKSYMIDHEYKVGNARGRIFDTDTKSIDTELGKSLFLRNSIYIPDTPQYADFIEAQDFGINWAVSVGVTLGASDCSVCGEQFSSWGYWCRQGHDKGLSYDPASEETDDWGYPLPCDPEDPSAVKCLRQFKDPKDFYELSQVFLGAQYFAALDKSAGGQFTTAKTAGGFLSVPSKIAKEIEFSHEPEKVQDARKRFEVRLDADGLVTWADEQDIEWVFDPLDPDATVLCAGRKDASETSEDDEDNQDEEVNEDGTPTEAGEELGSADGEGDDPEAGSDEEPGEGEVGSEVGSEEASGEVPVVQEDADDDSAVEDSEEEESEEDSDDDSEDESEEEEDDESDDDEASSSKIANTAKSGSTVKVLLSLLPDSLRQSEDKNSEDVAKAVGDYIKGLEEKAEIGNEYLLTLRADALSWYTRAHMQPTERGVKTAAFEKLLARVSDDPSLLKEIIQEHKEIAQSRFPKVVRRSSVPKVEVNESSDMEELSDYESSKMTGDSKVARRHGSKD